MKGNAIRLLIYSWLALAAGSMAADSAGVSADDALRRLLSGDKRIVAGKSEEPHGAALIERRHTLAKDQKPFAVIVSAQIPACRLNWFLM